MKKCGTLGLASRPNFEVAQHFRTVRWAKAVRLHPSRRLCEARACAPGTSEDKAPAFVCAIAPPAFGSRERGTTKLPTLSAKRLTPPWAAESIRKCPPSVGTARPEAGSASSTPVCSRKGGSTCRHRGTPRRSMMIPAFVHERSRTRFSSTQRPQPRCSGSASGLSTAFANARTSPRMQRWFWGRDVFASGWKHFARSRKPA